MILVFLFCLTNINFLCSSISNVDEIGIPEERFYKQLQIKTNFYNSCWKKALMALNSSCNTFNEETHSRLALSFANCFLINSGMNACICEETIKVSLCLRNCTDKVFAVYTEFYTHCQSICHYLQQINLQVEIFNTALILTRSSKYINVMLDQSLKYQARAFNLQKQMLKEQTKSLSSGRVLTNQLMKSRKQANEMHEEFKNSIFKQTMLILDIFEKLRKLHNFILGSLALFYSVIFYGTIIICIYTLTAMPATANARFILFFIIVINGIAEYIITTFTLNEKSQASEEVLYERIWLSREITSSLCLVILIYKYYYYTDVNQMLLMKIVQQNEEILSFLKDTGTKIPSGQVHSTQSLQLNSSDTENILPSDKLQSTVESPQFHQIVGEMRVIPGLSSVLETSSTSSGQPVSSKSESQSFAETATTSQTSRSSADSTIQSSSTPVSTTPTSAAATSSIQLNSVQNVLSFLSVPAKADSSASKASVPAKADSSASKASGTLFNPATSYWRYSSTDRHIVQMRGLGFDTTEEDIIQFFKTLGITPKKINLKRDGSGRIASFSEVEFSSHAEAVIALRKKNAFIGHRFIHLTLRLPESGNDSLKPTEKRAGEEVDLSSSTTVIALQPLFNNQEWVEKLRSLLPPSSDSRTWEPSDQLGSDVQSPLFQPALGMCSALQSGQLDPLKQQFGMSADVIAAVNSGGFNFSQPNYVEIPKYVSSILPETSQLAESSYPATNEASPPDLVNPTSEPPDKHTNLYPVLDDHDHQQHMPSDDAAVPLQNFQNISLHAESEKAEYQENPIISATAQVASPKKDPLKQLKFLKKKLQDILQLKQSIEDGSLIPNVHQLRKVSRLNYVVKTIDDMHLSLD